MEEAIVAKNISFNSLNGLQKAALLMIALEPDNAAQIIKNLDADDVEAISAEITKLKNVPADIIDKVLTDYYNMVTAREYVLEGGLEYAQLILEKSFGLSKAQEIIDKVRNITTLRGFDVLKKADSAQLVNFLGKEHPQTIALILSQLNPEQTSEALKELPEDIRADITYRIATLGKISPSTIKQVERVVDELAGQSMNQSISQLGGPKTVATILNRTGVIISKEVMNKIQERDPEIAMEIKRLMFIFDDIVHLQDRDIQKILKEIDRQDLALSLKIADEKTKEKIFSNMSERAVDVLKEELEFMGQKKLKEVEDAQARVIDVIKSLEEREEISLGFNGGNKEVYV